MGKGTAAMRIGAALACAALAAPAGAAVLYKSVSPTGVLQFSDLPPADARVLERIQISDSAASGATVKVAVEPGMARVDPVQADAAVGKASAQLDLAEHALAEARRMVVTGNDPLRLTSTRMNRSDMERLDSYKRDVLLARQTLLETLKENQKAAPPRTLTASNEWTPVAPINSTEWIPLNPAVRR
jgi:hypothetical protein